MSPTIVFVPGMWVGPKPFEECSERLKKAGYETRTAVLVSNGNVSNNFTLNHDIAGIRATVRAAVVDEGKEVVLVLHSGGGFLGSAAIRGLSLEERKAKDLAGGVSIIVFVAGGVMPEGTEHVNAPFFQTKGDEVWPDNPKYLFFNDLDDEAAAHWQSQIKPAPATGWNDTVFDCAWKTVPSVYVLCTKDQALPPDWQRTFAARAGSRKVVECDAGHMPMLSKPQELCDVIAQVAKEKLWM